MGNYQETAWQLQFCKLHFCCSLSLIESSPAEPVLRELSRISAPLDPAQIGFSPIDTAESDVTRKETTPGIVGKLASAPSNPAWVCVWVLRQELSPCPRVCWRNNAQHRGDLGSVAVEEPFSVLQARITLTALQVRGWRVIFPSATLWYCEMKPVLLKHLRPVLFLLTLYDRVSLTFIRFAIFQSCLKEPLFGCVRKIKSLRSGGLW